MVSCILFLCSRRLLSIGWSLSLPLSVLLASNVEMAPVIMWSERQKAKWYIERIFTCRIRFSSPVVFYSVRRVSFFHRVFFFSSSVFIVVAFFQHSFIFLISISRYVLPSLLCVFFQLARMQKKTYRMAEKHAGAFLRRFPTFFNFNIINFP